MSRFTPTRTYCDEATPLVMLGRCEVIVHSLLFLNCGLMNRAPLVHQSPQIALLVICLHNFKQLWKIDPEFLHPFQGRNAVFCPATPFVDHVD